MSNRQTLHDLIMLADIFPDRSHVITYDLIMKLRPFYDLMAQRHKVVENEDMLEWFDKLETCMTGLADFCVMCGSGLTAQDSGGKCGECK